MHLHGIYYSEPVYRPPSEANSLLIQVTEGCTYRCSFCFANLKKFKVRDLADIKKDMDTARKVYGADVRKMFFLDGNAMVISFHKLHELCEYATKLFPRLNRIGTYAHAKDILAKSDAELRSLQEAGLEIVYIGIESGNDQQLAKAGKRVTADEIVASFHKCFEAGITPSGTIILGLTGRDVKLAEQHILDTANLVNRASPVHVVKEGPLPVWYISCLALMFPDGSDVKRDAEAGTLTPQTAIGIMQEMKLLIENINDEVKNCVFRSNHASNYLPVKGRLSRDREKILHQINYALDHPENVKPEYLRGL
ncbi:MAG: radical SAM protein [Candidatus Cloacimonetes bacterium]|nr:radical SAM protein [Candidatus Cloacimonadota bacterium]MCF7814717.1 radical SAM protein [Candidatus Cloacimonadota bacterium]MCF7869142.1 radical SAM protein [Candidatus Cloacimonadota bacterium]MCF7884589.1 radical SAM protein [Candidatus Cloacimonadota bacterium]